MIQFNLGESDYIELNKLLKVCDLVNSGGDANALIINEQILLNGAVEIQKRKKVRAGDVVKYGKQEISIEK